MEGIAISIISNKNDDNIMDIMVFHRAYLSAPQGKRDYSNTLYLKQCENFVSRCIAANERKENSNMKALV